MSRTDPEFLWDEEKGIATCVLTYGNNKFTGTANCHPEDIDMMSEKTGCWIALLRAEIKFLKHIKNNILLPEWNAMKHLECSIKQNKNYDKTHYMAKAIKRQVIIKQKEYNSAKEFIEEKKIELKHFIDSKDEFYQKIRKNRQKDKNQ